MNVKVCVEIEKERLRVPLDLSTKFVIMYVGKSGTNGVTFGRLLTDLTDYH